MLRKKLKVTLTILISFALVIAFCSLLFKIFSQLREIAARYKERTRILTFGKSYEGRQLYAVEVNMKVTFISMVINC